MSLVPFVWYGQPGADGQEIKFGDNDTLSAISSSIVHADYLFLLTDVECLYTDNPRSNPDAKPVRVVRDIEKVKRQGLPSES